MDFSTMVLGFYLDADDALSEDERVLQLAIDQSVLAAELGYNPWFTEHHFRGPWHSAPLLFAAHVAAQIPTDRYLGFGVLSVPYYHPVRLVEQMNLLDQLTKGHCLFGLGSGLPGIEAPSAGLADDYHRSGQALRDAFVVMERLWAFESGDAPYDFALPWAKGQVVTRVIPSPYRRKKPTFIRAGRRNESIIEFAQNGWPAFIGTFGADLEEQAAIYWSALEGAGHPLEVLAHCRRWTTMDWLNVIVAETEKEALALSERAWADRDEVREKFSQRSGKSVVEPGIGRPMFAGTPDMVAERVERAAALGVNHILVRFHGEWAGRTHDIVEQSMRLFASEVMPRFAKTADTLS